MGENILVTEGKWKKGGGGTQSRVPAQRKSRPNEVGELSLGAPQQARDGADPGAKVKFTVLAKARPFKGNTSAREREGAGKSKEEPGTLDGRERDRFGPRRQLLHTGKRRVQGKGSPHRLHRQCALEDRRPTPTRGELTRHLPKSKQASPGALSWLAGEEEAFTSLLPLSSRPKLLRVVASC